MAFCLGSRLVVNCPLTEYLREAAQHFKVIELQADPSYFSTNYALTINEKKVLRIYRERYGFQLTMHAPFINLRLGALNLEERQLAVNIMINVMQAASDLEIKLITFHPCTLEPGAPEKYHENLLLEEGSIALLLKVAKQLGVTLLMENMPLVPEFHPKTTDGTRFQELLWLFPEPEFGLTIDIGHTLQAGVRPEGLLKMERIRHFHLHENGRSQDDHQPITTKLEWWEKLLKTLTKKFPDACGILEMSQFSDQVASLKELQPFLGKRSLPKPGKGQIIPPLIVD